MQLWYGSYAFPPNGVTIAISRQAKLAESGARYGHTERWLVRGLLEAIGQAAITLAIQTFERAMSTDYQDLVFRMDGGAASAHQALNSSTFSGVRVVGPPSYPVGQGAEFATYRTFEVTFEFDVLYSQASLISWTETVTKSGGGPLITFFTSLNALPQKQTLALATPFVARQAGSALGVTSYPAPALPNWPQALKKYPEITERAPKRSGNNLTEYRIDWVYEFESATALDGHPNSQPNL